MTSISLPGEQSFAPTTAARRSVPKVNGVLYPIETGTGVTPLSNSKTRNGSPFSFSINESETDETEDTIPFENGYFEQNRDKASTS